MLRVELTERDGPTEVLWFDNREVTIGRVAGAGQANFPVGLPPGTEVPEPTES